MPVELRYYTDPACEWSWGNEPTLRRLLWEFGGEITLRPVMGGLARSYDFGPGGDQPGDHVAHWLDAAADTGMPCDPRVWFKNPISSTYPACQAVCAAREQGAQGAYRYLRRLREGILCEQQKLDHADVLIATAGAAGLDRERFALDLRSHAITEAFGADLDEVRAVPDEARAAGAATAIASDGERITFPSARFVGADGKRHGLWGSAPYEAYADAARAAGAEPQREGPAEPLEVIDHFGRCATREIEELTGRPRPVVEAELWALAREWKLKPVPVLTGTLWERA